jgi:Sulfotransferase domain
MCKLRQAYAEHYAHVRAIVPKDRLLEYYPAEGWEPLCKFLGKEIPAEPFPNTNNPGQTNMNLWHFYKVIARSTVWNILSYVSITTAPIAAAGLGYAVYRCR